MHVIWGEGGGRVVLSVGEVRSVPSGTEVCFACAYPVKLGLTWSVPQPRASLPLDSPLAKLSIRKPPEAPKAFPKHLGMLRRCHCCLGNHLNKAYLWANPDLSQTGSAPLVPRESRAVTHIRGTIPPSGTKGLGLH